MKPAPFRYEAPQDLNEVFALLTEHGDDAKVLAGGQSLGPLLNLRMSTPSVLVDLASIPELRRPVTVARETLRIPAMTTYREALDDPALRAAAPLLAEAIPFVGHAAIRNAGTIGGSVAHADPAAELPTCLVALGASVGVSGPAGERTVDAKDFFTGTFSTVLAGDEIVAWVDVPTARAGRGTAWMEVAPRHGDYAVIGVAAFVDLKDDQVAHAHVSLSGVADRPTLVDVSERLAQRTVPGCYAPPDAPGASDTPNRPSADPLLDALNEAARDLAAGFTLHDDLVATARYKQHLTTSLIAQTLGAAIQRAMGEGGATR